MSIHGPRTLSVYGRSADMAESRFGKREFGILVVGDSHEAHQQVRTLKREHVTVLHAPTPHVAARMFEDHKESIIFVVLTDIRSSSSLIQDLVKIAECDPSSPDPGDQEHRTCGALTAPHDEDDLTVGPWLDL